MDMVNLMLGVEAEFDFTIPQPEITPENFQSVEDAGIDDRPSASARDGCLSKHVGGAIDAKRAAVVSDSAALT